MEQLQQTVQRYAPYLDQLRKVIYSAAILFIVAFAIGFFSAGRIILFFLENIDIPSIIVTTTSPFQFAHVAVDVGFFAAFTVVSPYIVWRMISFIAPAVTRRERRYIYVALPASLLLFTVGFLYGFMMLYHAFQFVAELNNRFGIQNFWDIRMFMSQIIFTSSLLGTLFQFPIIATLLIKAGVLSRKILVDKRRVGYFCMFIFVSLLPPTDGLSLIAMTLPLVMLYELTIVINK